MPEQPAIQPSEVDAALGRIARLFPDFAELPPPGSDFDASCLPAKGGVFALVTADHRLVQLLCASSIRRAVTQRLIPADGSRASAGPPVRDLVRHVWWRLGYSAFENDWLYLQIARQLLGPTYRDALAFAPVWYARIDMQARFPRWTVSDRCDPSAGQHAGPFITRKRAVQFTADLEDLFDLCRYHDVLVRAPDGERCAYYDMGKCPAPCDGTISLNVYRDMLAASVRFATGDGIEFTVQTQQKMTQAANAQEYERAQRLKETAERAEQALRRTGRFARIPDELTCLIVQRGPRRSTIRPFFCTGGVLEQGNDVAIKDVAAHVATWSARLRPSDKPRDIDTTYRAETAALVCHYLGKGERASGLYLNVQETGNCASAVQRIQSCFSRS